MSRCRLIYVTFPNRAVASRIAKLMLSQHLAACANLFPVESHYWWKGKMEQAREVAAVFKTTALMVRRFIREMKTVHPYEVPCIVALPILDGNPGYLKWIADTTRGK